MSLAPLGEELEARNQPGSLGEELARNEANQQSYKGLHCNDMASRNFQALKKL